MSLFDALLLDPASFQIWVADRTDRQRGSGTANDPYDGGAGKFDALMNQFASVPNLMIRLGPGTFTTKGYSDGASGGWQAKPWMKILGSGVEVTKLKLAGVTTNGVQYFVVGHPITSSSVAVDAFEISDLSVDCGADLTPTSAYGGMRIMGSHARIRRVKAVNWGTNTTSFNAYVFSLVTAIPDASPTPLEAVNTGIEDCYAISPGSMIAGGKVVVINVGGHDSLGLPKELQAKSPFMRNCYIDCGVVTPDPLNARFIALSMGWCRGGVIEGMQVYNADIAGPYQTTRSVRDMVVRNNFFKNVGRGLMISLGQPSSNLNSTNAGLAVASSVWTVSGGGLNTTSLSNGDRVVLITSTPPTGADKFTGVYVVNNVVNHATAGSFEISPVISSPTTATVTAVQRLLSIGRVVFEGNIVELAPLTTVASPPAALGFFIDDGSASYVQSPDFTHGDLIFRNNKIRYVDGFVQPGYTGEASRVNGTKNLQSMNNVIESVPANPMKNARSGSASYFNSRTPVGALVQGYNADSLRKYDELETMTEDAFVLAFAELG